MSDWSSDVCSSDLAFAAPEVAYPRDHLEHRLLQHVRRRIAVAADAHGQGEHRALEAAVDLFEGRALAGPSASQQRVRDLDREARGAAGYGGGRGGGGKGFDQHSPAWMPWRGKASQAAATGLQATYPGCIHRGRLPCYGERSYQSACSSPAWSSCSSPLAWCRRATSGPSD